MSSIYKNFAYAFARLDVLGSLRSHGALAKIRYALALNGNARNHNENSTFPLILARLSLRSCLCSGKRKRLFCKSRWKINRKKEKGKGKFV